MGPAAGPPMRRARRPPAARAWRAEGPTLRSCPCSGLPSRSRRTPCDGLLMRCSISNSNICCHYLFSFKNINSERCSAARRVRGLGAAGARARARGAGSRARARVNEVEAAPSAASMWGGRRPGCPGTPTPTPSASEARSSWWVPGEDSRSEWQGGLRECTRRRAGGEAERGSGREASAREGGRKPRRTCFRASLPPGSPRLMEPLEP